MREDKSLKLHIKYYAMLMEKSGYNALELTGDDIDTFFSPSGFFFQRADQFKSKPVDLIYGKYVADSYNFTYKNENVQVDLYYGNILSKGVASDLKLHPKLEVRFNKTDNIEIVHQIYSIIVKFLQLVRHQTKYNLKPAIVYSYRNNKLSELGILYEKAYITKNYILGGTIDYLYFHPYINNLLQLIADNMDLNLNFFPDLEENSYFYNVKRYLSIFAAFEYECNKNPESYERTSDSTPDNIKKQLKKEISKLAEQEITDIEKSFLELANQKISQIGTQFGQRKKIINAYYKNENIMKYSMGNIFPKGFNLKEIANDLSNLRGKIVHNNFHKDFNYDEISKIRFLDILTYVMILKRAGLDDAGIELIIGAVFRCNFKYMEYRLKK